MDASSDFEYYDEQRGEEDERGETRDTSHEGYSHHLQQQTSRYTPHARVSPANAPAAPSTVRLCDNCKEPVDHKEFTIIRCGHIFHIECGLQFLSLSEPCIACSVLLGPLSNSNIIMNNWFGPNTIPGPKQKIATQATMPHQRITAPRHSGRCEKYNGIPIVLDKLEELMASRIDLRELKAKIGFTLKLEHLTSMGIDCDLLMRHGYKLEDLHRAVPLKQHDLNQLGFTYDFMNAMFVTLDFMYQQLGFRYPTLLTQYRDMQFHHLEQMKVTPELIRKMGFDIPVLISLGFTMHRAPFVFNRFQDLTDLGMTIDDYERIKIPPNDTNAMRVPWPTDFIYMNNWITRERSTAANRVASRSHLRTGGWH